jgi:hypothetical protein
MIIVPGSFAQFPFIVRVKEEDLVKVPYCTEIEAVMFQYMFLPGPLY